MLYLAAAKGDLEKVKQIVEESRDDSYYWDLETVRQIVERVKNEYYTSDTDTNPPAEVTNNIHYHNLETIIKLVEEARDNITPSNFGMLVQLLDEFNNNFHSRDIESAIFFVNKVRDSISSKYTTYRSAICLASKGGYVEVVKYLLEEAKAEFKGINEELYKMALYFASEEGHLPVIKYLTKEVKYKIAYCLTALRLASKKGHLPVVRFLIEEIKINAHNKSQFAMTALHIASEEGHLEFVRYLVEEAKVDINIKDDFGSTALHYASKGRQFEIVIYLVKKTKINVNLVDNNRKSPLHWVSFLGYFEIVKYLVEEADININTLNNNQKTALKDLGNKETLLNSPNKLKSYNILKSANIGQKLAAKLELIEEEQLFMASDNYNPKYYNNRLSKRIAEKQFNIANLEPEEIIFRDSDNYNPKYEEKYQLIRERVKALGEHLRVKKTEGGYKWNSELQKIEEEVSRIEPQSLKEFDFPEDATNVMANFLTTRDAQKIPLVSYSIAKDLGKIKPRNIVEAYKDTEGNLHDGKGAISSRWIPVKALKTPDGELIEVNSDQNDERYVDMQMHPAVYMGSNGQYQIHSDTSPQDRRTAQEEIETQLENQQLEEESRYEVSDPKDFLETNNEESLPLPGDLDPLSLSHHI